MEKFTKRQMEIIDAGIKLISEQGIQGLTIRNLSRRIGITEPAIYRHFENKNKLILVTLSYFENILKNIFKEAEKDQKAPEQIKNIFLKKLEKFSEKPELTAVVFSEEIFQNEKEFSRKVFSTMEWCHKRLISIIKAGQGKNEIRQDIPPQDIAIVILGTVRLLVSKWRLSGFKFDLIEEGKKLWKTLEKLMT